MIESDIVQRRQCRVSVLFFEAVTSEKVCIRAGPEFGELEGHLLIIYKALYGLRLSGKLFGQLLQECLRDLGFEPSLAESTIYMRKCPTADHYEYVATYVDDLCMIMKDPILVRTPFSLL